MRFIQLCLLLFFFGFAQAQTVEDIVNTYVEAFNADDTDTILNLFPEGTLVESLRPVFERAVERVVIDPGSVTISEYTGGDASAALDYVRESDGRRRRGSVTVTQVLGGRYVLQPSSWAFYDLAEPENPGLTEWLGLAFNVDGRLVLAGGLALLVLSVGVGLMLGRLSVREKLRFSQKDLSHDAETWALAIGAIHSVMMGLPLDRLIHNEDAQRLAEDLALHYNVRERHDLLESLVLFFHNGNAPDIKQAQAKDERLPQTNPLAFDLSHYIYLCSAGASLGLLDIDEAQTFMLRGAHKAQASYKNWHDYAEGFKAGYDVNLLIHPLDNQMMVRQQEKRIKRIVQTLLSRKKSPWQRLKWQTSLPKLDTEDSFTRATRAYLSEALFYIDEASFTPSLANWALAVAAIYRVQWGQPLDTLIDDESAPLYGRMLQEDWDVTNRDHLLNALMWLHHDGHRGALRDLQSSSSALPQAEPLSWDYVRYCQLCTAGVAVHYLQPEEALSLLIPAAAALQKSYTSWTDLAVSFRAGRYLWHRLLHHSPADTRASDERMIRTLELLETDPRSPWQKIPWQTLAQQTELHAERSFFELISARYLAAQGEATQGDSEKQVN